MRIRQASAIFPLCLFPSYLCQVRTCRHLNGWHTLFLSTLPDVIHLCGNVLLVGRCFVYCSLEPRQSMHRSGLAVLCGLPAETYRTPVPVGECVFCTTEPETACLCSFPESLRSKSPIIFRCKDSVQTGTIRWILTNGVAAPIFLYRASRFCPAVKNKAY